MSGRVCSVEGCEKPHYGRGLCQACYTRQRRRGTTEFLVRTPRPAAPCSVEGCANMVGPKSARGLCASHYSRLVKRGNLKPEVPLRPYGAGHITPDGYRLIHLPDHPLVRESGYVLEHRLVAYSEHGPGPHPCWWCELVVEWDDIHVDHLDGERLNNAPTNLVLACQACNKERGAAGNPSTFRPRRLA